MHEEVQRATDRVGLVLDSRELADELGDVVKAVGDDGVAARVRRARRGAAWQAGGAGCGTQNSDRAAAAERQICCASKARADSLGKWIRCVTFRSSLGIRVCLARRPYDGLDKLGLS